MNAPKVSSVASATQASGHAISAKTETRIGLARSIGLAAFIYGYPLVESMRTCRLQTEGSSATPARAPMDTLHHIVSPSTDQDRDVVTPANDLLYTTAWINLVDGPRLLTVPSSAKYPGHYFVLSLYDAYTENFENLGPRNCSAEGETVLLLGPNGAVPSSLQGYRVVRCPTDLVWLIGRILTGSGEELATARQLQTDIHLEPAPGPRLGRKPLAVAQWVGEPVDAIAAAFEQQQPAIEVAPAFFTNMCHALCDAPGRPEDLGMLAWLGQAGLTANPHFSWDALDEPTRKGLVEGFSDAAAHVVSAARSRRARPWVIASRAGRYGNDYMVRALTSYIGLGALATDEALYCSGHFDAEGQLLDGAHSYTMTFAANAMPPAHAFWSVALYDADRFLYPNALGRHSIGDRTPGLHRAADGSLTITLSHTPPPEPANWLPAPAGRFYLMLRLYQPHADARSWKVPPLEKTQ